MKNSSRIVIAFLVAVVLVVGIVIAPIVLGQRNPGTSRPAANSPAANSSTDNGDNPITAAVSNSLPKDDTGPLNWAESALQIIGRLFIAVLLSSVLAFRPRKDVPLFRR